MVVIVGDAVIVDVVAVLVAVDTSDGVGVAGTAVLDADGVTIGSFVGEATSAVGWGVGRAAGRAVGRAVGSSVDVGAGSGVGVGTDVGATAGQIASNPMPGGLAPL